MKPWVSSTASKPARFDAMTALLFWVAAGFVFYVYAGYPILLCILQLVFRSSPEKAPIQPTVSLLVAAYNEERVIAGKIRNSLALDYPPELLEIVVASDGSTDGTGQIVTSLAEAHPRVRLLDFSQNRGKVAALNEAVPQLEGEIVAFSDASSVLEPDSVRRLVESFADPRVGAVSGVYRLLKKEQAELGMQESFYWKYETFLKVQEAKLGGFTGAHGSLYAVRKRLYPYPAERIINDDFVIPLRIQKAGYRVAYEPAAVAFEEAHEMEGFSRRVRITAGNVEQLREIGGLIAAGKPFAAFCLLSHKAGRLLVPLVLVTLAAANVLLLQHPLYRYCFAGQAVFYALAALGAFVSLRPRFLRLPYYFCMINSSFFAWMYHAIRLGRPIPARVELDQLGNRGSST